LTVNIKGIHEYPNYYENPTLFNPYRWNSPPKNVNAFLPFGLGIQACIGMKMAILEIKTIIIGLLQTFSFSMDEDHEPLKLSS